MKVPDPKDTRPRQEAIRYPTGKLVDQREGRRLTDPPAKVLLPDRSSRRLGKDGLPYDSTAEQTKEAPFKAAYKEEHERTSEGHIKAAPVVEAPPKPKPKPAKKKTIVGKLKDKLKG